MNTSAISGEVQRLGAATGAPLVLAASAREGLIVHAAGERATRADAVAALFAGIFQRTVAAADAHGCGSPRLLSVRAGADHIMVAGAGEIVLVIIAGGAPNVGRLRLELLRTVTVLA